MSAAEESPTRATGAGDPAGLSPERPWPGLQYFTTPDAPFFAGRDSEIDEVCRLIRRQEHFVLFGKSGLGKTSLLRAGVIPRLRSENYFSVPLRIIHTPGAPEPIDQVRTALATVFQENGIDARLPAADETLWEYFHRAGERFWKGVRPCLPVLVFDQFEEFFTLGRLDPESRRRSESLLAELECLLENRPPPAVQQRFETNSEAMESFDFSRRDFKVVWSLREDFLPDLEGLRGRFPDLGSNRFRLSPLTGKGAMAAVLKPGGHLLDEATAVEIVRRVVGLRPGAEKTRESEQPLEELRVEPSLLSLMCFELNLSRLSQTPPGARIDSELVRKTGDRILTDFYQRTVAGLPDTVCAFIEESLLTGQGRFRQSAVEDDFLVTPGATREHLQRLIDGRLVRRDERFGAPTIELTHDVLVGPVREFREKRRLRKQAEEDERRRIEAEEKVQHQHLELARRRRLNWILAGLTAFLFAALGVAANLYFKADSNFKLAQQQTEKAEQETRKADEAADKARAETERAVRAENEAKGNLKEATEQKQRADEEAKKALAEAGRAGRAETIAKENLEAAQTQKAIAEEQTQKTQTALALTKQANVARNKALFLSYVDGGITLASSGNFSAARQAIQLSRDTNLEAVVSAPQQATRDLAAWYVNLMSVTNAQMNPGDGTELRDLAVTEDGSRLATLGIHGEVRIFDVSTGKSPLHWNAYQVPVILGESIVGGAVSWDATGTRLLYGGHDERVVCWSVAGNSNVLEAAWTAPGAVVGMAREGALLAVACKDGSVALGTIPRLNFKILPGLVSNLTAVALSPKGPKGQFLAAVSSSGNIQFWSLKDHGDSRPPDARAASPIPYPGAHFQAVAFHPSGEYLATAGDEGIIHLRSVPDGVVQMALRGHLRRVTGLTFFRSHPNLGTNALTRNPSGPLRLVSSGWDRVLKVWDVAESDASKLGTGGLIRVLDGHTAGISGVVANDDRCFSGGLDGTWREWQPLRDTAVHFLDAGSDRRPTAVAVAPDGSQLAVGYADGGLRGFQLSDGRPRWATNSAHDGEVTRLAFQSDSEGLISVGHDGFIRRWDRNGRRLGTEIPKAPGPLNAVVFSPEDPHRLAVAGRSGSIRLANDPDQLISDHKAGIVLDISLDPPGHRAFRVHQGEAFSVGFRPGSAPLPWISAGRDEPGRQVVRWPNTPGDPALTYVRTALQNEVAWAAVSPDGNWVASGGRDGVLSLARADGSSEPRLLAGHEDTIIRLAFSPDSAHVFTVGADGTMRVWETETDPGSADSKSRSLFTVQLPVSEADTEKPLWDFDVLGRDSRGETWIAVPLVRGTVAVYRLGRIYPVAGGSDTGR